MAEPKNLTPGTKQGTYTADELNEREAVLRLTVEKYLPEFVAAVRHKGADVITLHQDAFAAGYHDDEYMLLGMALKYAGLFNRSVMLLGRCGETC